MRILPCLLLCCLSALAQPYKQNVFTTNQYSLGTGSGVLIMLAGVPAVTASTQTNVFLRSQGSSAPPIFDTIPSSSGVNYWERTSTTGYDFLSPSNITDSVSIGPNSVYAGANLAVGVGGTIDVGSERNIATGLIGTITGDDNAAFNQPGTITGNMNAVFGSGHTVSGTNNAVFGLGNTVTGLRLFVIGQGQTVTDNDTFYSFLPSRFSTYLTLNSKTNRISDSGTAVTYNGIALSTNSGTVTGSGTANSLTKFLSTSVITNSVLSDDGTNAWTTGTGAFGMPIGTTAQQPGSPTNGMIRYNSTTSRSEFYSGGAWRNHVRLDGDTMTGPLTDTNAVLVTPTISGPTVSGQVTNTSTFNGTFANVGTLTNTGAMGVSGAATFGGAGTFPTGTSSAPSVLIAGTTNSGIAFLSSHFYWVEGGVYVAEVSGNGVEMQLGSFLGLGGVNSSSDARLYREGAAIFQLGPDAAAQATPTSYILKGADALAGTGTNINGASVTIAGGRSTGTGTGGSVIFQTAPAGSTGTSSNALVTRLTIDSTGLSTFAGQVSASSGFSSTDATAAVSIASGGWTNTFGKNAVVYLDGTAMTYTIYNNAGTAIYTNAVSVTGEATVILQPSGKVLVTAGTGVNGRATPF